MGSANRKRTINIVLRKCWLRSGRRFIGPVLIVLVGLLHWQLFKFVVPMLTEPMER